MPGEAPFITTAVLGIAAASAWVLRPLMVAFGRRLEGKRENPLIEEDMAEMRVRLLEMESELQRLADVESRLDFAERLLAQREAGQLPPAREIR